jgi:hypothetical protein
MNWTFRSQLQPWQAGTPHHKTMFACYIRNVMSHQWYLPRLIVFAAVCSVLFLQKRVLTGMTIFACYKWLHRINKDSNFANNTSPNIRMSFELHDCKIPKNTFTQHNPDMLCPLGKESQTGVLPPSLMCVDAEQDFHGFFQSSKILDLTVTISTTLKLLFIGDSGMVQLAQVFDELLEGREQENDTCKVLCELWSGHEGGTAVMPTGSGGVSANWHVTGLSPANRVVGEGAILKSIHF